MPPTKRRPNKRKQPKTPKQKAQSFSKSKAKRKALVAAQRAQRGEQMEKCRSMPDAHKVTCGLANAQVYKELGVSMASPSRSTEPVTPVTEEMAERHTSRISRDHEFEEQNFQIVMHNIDAEEPNNPRKRKLEHWLLTKQEMIDLEAFDLNDRYGPTIGLTRKDRWLRATALSLKPPSSVLDTLETLDDGDAEHESIWTRSQSAMTLIMH